MNKDTCLRVTDISWFAITWGAMRRRALKKAHFIAKTATILQCLTEPAKS
jgi:hypothetical protein